VARDRGRERVAHDDRDELVALVVEQVDHAGVPRDEAVEVVGDRRERGVVVRLRADLAQRLEDRVELLDERAGLLLRASCVLEHLEAVDGRRRLVGDHLGQDVHALHGRLVPGIGDDLHVRERIEVASRLDPERLRRRRVALGVRGGGEDLPAQEVAEDVTLGRDRYGAVEQAVPALEDDRPGRRRGVAHRAQVAVRTAAAADGRGAREVLAQRDAVRDRGRVLGGRVDDHRGKPERLRERVLDRLQGVAADQISQAPRRTRRRSARARGARRRLHPVPTV
jgi:hypothetical protein